MIEKTWIKLNFLQKKSLPIKFPDEKHLIEEKNAREKFKWKSI